MSGVEPAKKPVPPAKTYDDYMASIRWELSIPSNLQNSGAQLTTILNPILDAMDNYMHEYCTCKDH
ncbi:MAG TPA: hypothetical protein VGE97_09315 [Nitrososphaera sp.]|jgi:hypothetical protein